MATLLAVVIYFFKDLKELSLDFIKAIKNKDYKNENFKIVNYIILTTIITGIIGFTFKKPTKFLMSNPKIICLFLFITGLILLTSEKFYKGNKKIALKNAILIGIAQGFAVFPGFSRSGLTISTALFYGIERVKAARFSFLMSIPIIFLASMIYPLFELNLSEIASFNYKAILLGFISSFIVGYLCIKYFMKLLGRLSLRIFGYYCLVVAVLMFGLFQVYYHQ